MNIKFEEHKVKLHGAANIRDLGGYPTSDGKKTKSGVYFRSDSLHALTAEDIDILKSLGITMQLDLRSFKETAADPSIFEDANLIKYLNISLLDNVQSSGFKSLPEDMSVMYCGLLENNKEKFASIFRAFIANSGACIFNCTAGKDRTGVVSMLLLKLAGVIDEAVVFDYTRSEANMADIFLIQKAQLACKGYFLPEHIFRSEPNYIINTLAHIKNLYADVKDYLKACGLNVQEIELLKNRLFE